MRKRRIRAVVAATAALSMVWASVALADEVVNDVPPDVETDVKTATITEGDTLTVTYQILDTGPNACDANAAGVTVEIEAPSDVDVSPSSLTWTQAECTDEVQKSATFTSDKASNYDITHTIRWTARPGASRTMTNKADFLLVVQAAGVAPTLNPVVTPAQPDGLAGWYVSDVSIDWGIAGDPTPTIVEGCETGPFTEDGVYDETCTVQNALGTATESISFQIDKTPPSITASVSPAANEAGWHNEDVLVTFECDDELSGVVACPAPVTVSTEAASQTVSGEVFDVAGNQATASVTISLDKTPPSITASVSPAANEAGWHNEDVLVTFECDDELSGVVACPAPVTVSTEAASQTVSGTVFDVAGNQATASVTISLDKTPPSVALIGGPEHGGSYVFGSVPDAPTCEASDALSGLAAPCEVDGYSTAVGTHTVEAKATDKAGNTATVERTYTVEAWTLIGFSSPVRMGEDVVNVMKGGRTVPLKFEVFAGEIEITDTADVSTFRVYSASCENLTRDEEAGNEITDAQTTTGKTEFRPTPAAVSGRPSRRRRPARR
jgi:hypothetical protein